jgi:hypothetical protein
MQELTEDVIDYVELNGETQFLMTFIAVLIMYEQKSEVLNEVFRINFSIRYSF